MIEGTLRIETGHMTETGIVMIVEDLGGARETVDLEIEKGLGPVTKVRREGVLTVESQDILRRNVRSRKGIKLSKYSKRHRCSRYVM